MREAADNIVMKAAGTIFSGATDIGDRQVTDTGVRQVTETIARKAAETNT